MRRRKLLTAGAASVGVFAGCPDPFDHDHETYSPEQYSFAGVAVIAHGSSVDYQPYEVTAEVRSADESISKKSANVHDEKNPHMLALTISGGLSPHSKHTICLDANSEATEAEGSREVATDELSIRDTKQRFLNKTVAFCFLIFDLSSFSYKPRVVTDDWPESGVDLHPRGFLR
ncbi:MAG: hypothetical protein J07HX5_00634 [halophilic archaeon J07HX5]|jgi:hypothetical protein|nr:MAG: hypothetical protein J07HX5_00634 [halophilic archaeon J07HX5]